MKLGALEIEGKAALAPMAGVTDTAYRRICMEFGAAYTVTEMVSAKAVEYGDKKTAALADLSRDYRPVFLQLFGESPETMALAGEKLLSLKPDGIDINMGCPVPKVAGNGAGSALLKDPEKCAAMVSALKKRLTECRGGGKGLRGGGRGRHQRSRTHQGADVSGKSRLGNYPAGQRSCEDPRYR